jgi:hypothetical protein
MIRTSGGWVHKRDLERSINGRVDPPELVERCEKYLAEEWSESGVKEHAPTVAQAQQVQAELAAECVRKAAKLEEANAAISRLLAFVPARAHELPNHRLQALVIELSRATNEAFPAAPRVVITTAPETDTETEACHQISVSVSLPTGVDMASIVAGVSRVHYAAATFLTPDELMAVRVDVNPQFIEPTASSESGR